MGDQHTCRIRHKRHRVPRLILGVLLAAGLSRRYGPEDKLLARWKGPALVQHAAGSLLASGCDRLLAVVSSGAVAAALPAGFTLATIPRGLPMSQSWAGAVRHGQKAGAQKLLFALGDMPNITSETLIRLIAIAEETAGGAACSHAGIAMPPACFPLATCLGILTTDDGDRGARPLLAALPDKALLPLSGDEALDIDRPQDRNPHL